MFTLGLISSFSYTHTHTYIYIYIYIYIYKYELFLKCNEIIFFFFLSGNIDWKSPINIDLGHLWKHAVHVGRSDFNFSWVILDCYVWLSRTQEYQAAICYQILWMGFGPKWSSCGTKALLFSCSETLGLFTLWKIITLKKFAVLCRGKCPCVCYKHFCKHLNAR